MKNIETINIRNQILEQTERLIESGKLHGKKLIVFGANVPCECVAERLEQAGYQISAVVDNDKKRRNRVRQGIMKPFLNKYMVESPKEVLGDIKNKEEVFVLIAAKSYDGMCKELESMGYDAKKQTVQFWNFQTDPEILCPGKQVISQEEMKEIEVDLLDYFHEFCESIGLRHYLCGGTLLGAVRHKGFIPWDDDIDVLMPVPDYLKFLTEFKETERYALQNSNTCMSPYMFTRLVRKDTVLDELCFPFRSRTGINIDIFPISGYPESEQEVEQFSQELIQHRADWDKFWFSYGSGVSEENRYKELTQETYDLMTRYDFDTSSTVGYIVTAKLTRELLPRECFKSTLELPFEGKMYPVFNGYKTYLENLYDDYMSLPPEFQRISKHIFTAWYE